MDGQIELKFGGVVDIGITQPINGWIFQRTSELEAAHHTLNSSRFSSRFDRPPVYHGLPEIPPSELDEILHGCCRLNSAKFTKAIVKAMLEEEVILNINLLSRKAAQSPEDKEVEPPSSMDDSSMILKEIRVDVDECHRPNMMI